MARRNNESLNKIKGGFVAVTFEMINSKAFKELTGSALKSLILCMRKVKTHNPIDRFQFQFSLTYPEAKKQGIAHSSFSRGMKLLQGLGFVDCVMRGGMRFDGNLPSRYRLSQRWKNYATTNFKAHWDGYSDAIHGEKVF